MNRNGATVMATAMPALVRSAWIAYSYARMAYRRVAPPGPPPVRMYVRAKPLYVKIVDSKTATMIT